jgi:large subunit ribosomal protein L4
MKDEKAVKKTTKKTSIKKTPDSAKVAAEVFEEKLPVAAVKKAKVSEKASTTPVVAAKNTAKTKVTATNLSVKVFDTQGRESGSVSLPEEVFGAKINKTLMAQAVRVYLANQRQGTQSTKTRGEVIGSTRKIYRQKGTGKARHGAVKAPIFVGGGVALGPKPRDHSLKMPQKMRKASLASALTQQLKQERIVVLDAATHSGKTKDFAMTLKVLNLQDKNGKGHKVLVVSDSTGTLDRAGRNIEGLKMVRSTTLNTYEVLTSRHIVLVKSSIEALAKTFEK